MGGRNAKAGCRGCTEAVGGPCTGASQLQALPHGPCPGVVGVQCLSVVAQRVMGGGPEGSPPGACEDRGAWLGCGHSRVCVDCDSLNLCSSLAAAVRQRASQAPRGTVRGQRETDGRGSARGLASPHPSWADPDSGPQKRRRQESRQQVEGERRARAAARGGGLAWRCLEQTQRLVRGLGAWPSRRCGTAPAAAWSGAEEDHTRAAVHLREPLSHTGRPQRVSWQAGRRAGLGPLPVLWKWRRRAH